MPTEDQDPESNYRAAFNQRLDFGKRPAVLIVDVSVAYLDPASPLYAGVEDALACNVRLAVKARQVGVPVIFTRVEYVAGGADGGLFYRKVPGLSVFDRGSALGAFPSTLQPLPGELVVTKQYASAFFGTSLADTLRKHGIDTLLIGGFSTSGCVRATALDACQHGFLPFVVRQACGDRHAAPHEASLFDLQAKYAEVIDVSVALDLLVGQGG